MTDLNGNQHEYVAEAFDTTWNVFILLYLIRALTSTTILLPTDFEAHAGISETLLPCRRLPTFANVAGR